MEKGAARSSGPVHLCLREDLHVLAVVGVVVSHVVDETRPTTLDAGCTIGVGAFVHYGVTMGDGSVLAADSFLMKGETVPPCARWAGNPAREM